MAFLGEDIKKLGFGLMRLPMMNGEVDEEQVKQMVDLFLAAGGTYFDTAYGYLDGKSEKAVKTCLVDRYPRESFQLATKLPAWDAKNPEEAKQMVYTSLERTGAGYFDFYLLHNVGAERTQIFEDYHMWEYARELKEKGLVRHIGFSMHDTADQLDAVLSRHPEAEFVQLQINYADWENAVIQSRACYETARRHKKPIIIMEPVKGGLLASLPEEIARIFEEADPGVAACGKGFGTDSGNPSAASGESATAGRMAASGAAPCTKSGSDDSNEEILAARPSQASGAAPCSKPRSAGKNAENPAARPSQASWALRYAASLPGVITVLSGMSDLAQMQDNLSFMTDFIPLSEEERETVAKVARALENVEQIPCTSCKYCVNGCPMKIPIPEVFNQVNQYLKFRNLPRAKRDYLYAVKNGGAAETCVACGQCESVCPQKLPIIEELKRAAELFAS